MACGGPSWVSRGDPASVRVCFQGRLGIQQYTQCASCSGSDVGSTILEYMSDLLLMFISTEYVYIYMYIIKYVYTCKYIEI